MPQKQKGKGAHALDEALARRAAQGDEFFANEREFTPAPSGRASGVEATYPAGEVNLDLIDANPYQPRQNFPKKKLLKLGASMLANSQIEPLVVRKNREKPGRYQLIAGERRLLAARAVGITKLFCIVREVDDLQAAKMAREENDEREDLTPIERAYSFLIIGFLTMGQRPPEFAPLAEVPRGFPFDAIAGTEAMTGRSVRRYVSLFGLPVRAFNFLANRVNAGGKTLSENEMAERPLLSEKHGRALLSLHSPQHQAKLMRAIEAEGLSGDGALKRAGMISGKVTPGTKTDNGLNSSTGSGFSPGAGQSSGSGFDQATTSISSRGVELGLGDTSTSTVGDSRPQENTSGPPDPVRDQLTPARNFLAEAWRNCQNLTLTPNYRRDLLHSLDEIERRVGELRSFVKGENE